MIAAGVFEEDERLELLEGVIVQMSPQSPRHAVVITRLCDPQFAAVGPDCLVRAQLPLTLEPDSEPEPDVAVVRRAEGGDRHRHPSSALAVFEVASDSLRKDRLAKAVLYADEVVITTDADAMAKHAGSFDMILDTVSADHDLNAFLSLLKRDATLVLVGAPGNPQSLNVFGLLLPRRSLAGSLIGGLPETQEMLDFCGKHGVRARSR